MDNKCQKCYVYKAIFYCPSCEKYNRLCVKCDNFIHSLNKYKFHKRCYLKSLNNPNINNNQTNLSNSMSQSNYQNNSNQAEFSQNINQSNNLYNSNISNNINSKSDIYLNNNNTNGENLMKIEDNSSANNKTYHFFKSYNKNNETNLSNKINKTTSNLNSCNYNPKMNSRDICNKCSCYNNNFNSANLNSATNYKNNQNITNNENNNSANFNKNHTKTFPNPENTLLKSQIEEIQKNMTEQLNKAVQNINYNGQKMNFNQKLNEIENKYKNEIEKIIESKNNVIYDLETKLAESYKTNEQLVNQINLMNDDNNIKIVELTKLLHQYQEDINKRDEEFLLVKGEYEKQITLTNNKNEENKNELCVSYENKISNILNISEHNQQKLISVIKEKDKIIQNLINVNQNKTQEFNEFIVKILQENERLKSITDQTINLAKDNLDKNNLAVNNNENYVQGNVNGEGYQ